jgi:SAM-dependent methyltransferase
MTCAAQAAEILGPLAEPSGSLLDAGCGGGYYWWSFADRGIELDWHGIDYTPEMIELARSELAPRAGLEPERFRLAAIEDLDEERYDNVLCFNVLTNSPHYALPLERLLRAADRRILLRESLSDDLVVRYTPDPYLDEGKRHLRVYHNTYPIDEVEAFMEEHGFRVTRIRDERTGDGTEMVVDIPHQWRILLGER